MQQYRGCLNQEAIMSEGKTAPVNKDKLAFFMALELK